MWSMQDAEARLSALVDAALADQPQRIVCRGKPTVVVVSAEEWERTERRARTAGLRAHLLALRRADRVDEADPFPRTDVQPRDI